MEINRVGQILQNALPSITKDEADKDYSVEDKVTLNSNKPSGVTAGDVLRVIKKDPETLQLNWKFEWEAEADSYRTDVLVMADGSVYSCRDKVFVRINPLDGKKVWEKKFHRSLSGKFALTGASSPHDTLLVATDDNKLHALDPATGKEKWKIDLMTAGFKVGPDGTIYTQQYDGKQKFVALTPDGKEKYKFPFNGHIEGIKFPDNSGAIIYENGDNTIIALNPDGSKLWQVKGNDVECFPQDPLHVFILTEKYLPDPKNPAWRSLNYMVSAHDPKTGEKKWEKLFTLINFMGETDGRLYVSEPRHLHCLNRDTGETLWTKEGNHLKVKAVGNDGTLFIGTAEGIEAVDPATGNTMWKRKTIKVSNNSIPSYVTKHGELITADETRLYVLNTETGSVMATFIPDKGVEGFSVSTDERKVFLEETSTGTIYSAALETEGRAEKILHNIQKEKPDNPKIINSSDFVEIGGVKLPKRGR